MTDPSHPRTGRLLAAALINEEGPRYGTGPFVLTVSVLTRGNAEQEQVPATDAVR